MIGILRHLMALCRFILFLLATIILGIVQLLWRAATIEAYVIPQFFQQLICWVLNIKVTVKGRISPHKPLVLMANHLSWADIMVLGSTTPCRFVAKQEVASWPFFNIFAYLQNTVFIERSRKGTMEGTNKLAETIKQDPRIYVLFPEGSNSYTKGKFLPFKSSYFSVVEGNPMIAIQPVALNIVAVENKKDLSQEDYEYYAWGDVGFFKHLWRFFGRYSHHIEVHYLPVIETANKDRKILASETEAAINQRIHSLPQN
jgi:1-acyl-sn-glycerol-3-phosphate acyltransferase